jgi:hypothetical protein
MVVAAGSREPAPLDPVHGTPSASPSASSPDRSSLRLRERNSSMKNRKRESCTSGTVRDEDGNILIYSARHDGTIHALRRPASEKRQGTKSREMGRRRCRGRRVPRALRGFCRGIVQQDVRWHRLLRSYWLVARACLEGCTGGARGAGQVWRRDWMRIDGRDASLITAGGEPAGIASVVADVARR